MILKLLWDISKFEMMLQGNNSINSESITQSSETKGSRVLLVISLASWPIYSLCVQDPAARLPELN